MVKFWGIGLLLLSLIVVAALSQPIQRQQGRWQIIAEGFASITADEKSARQEALRGAARTALEQVLRKIIPDEDKAKANLFLEQPERFTEVEAILDEQKRGDRYWVRARVTVFVSLAPDDKTPLLTMLKELGVLRKWRVMVVIPETHLQRIRIPDPAAETEIVRRLVEAGFSVVDQASVRALRYTPLALQAAEGDMDAIRQLGKRFGVDILIVGEAFSQLTGRTPIRDEVLKTTTELVSCRARVEVRAVRVDTLEVVAAEGAHASGAEATEELASKKALQIAGASIAASLLDTLITLPAPRLKVVKIVLSGWKNREQAGQFEEALRRLPQLHSVVHLDYDQGTNICQVETSAEVAAQLARILEQHPSLKPFRISIIKDSPGLIQGRVGLALSPKGK